MCMYLNDKQDRVCQGEIYRNLIFLEFLSEKKQLDVLSTPYALVLIFQYSKLYILGYK